MSIELLIGFVALGVIFVISILLMWRAQERRWRQFLQNQKNDQTLSVITQWLQDMRGGLDRNTSSLQQQLQMTNRIIGDRLDNAAQVINKVSKELGQVEEIGRQIKEFQNFLRSPKLRGNIGEQILRDLLEQVLPRPNFKLQHRFSYGQIVDAVIVTDKGLIPVDAKFPLDNFRQIERAQSENERRVFIRNFSRDVKKHINDVSAKYILPAEGTVDFAIMYIPSESIYYEIIAGDAAVSEYAQTHHVVIVSPNSFYYFLQIILMGLEGQKIEETAKRILNALSAIKKDSAKVGDGLRVLNSHVTNAKNAMDRVNSDFLLLTGKIDEARHIETSSTNKYNVIPPTQEDNS